MRFVLRKWVHFYGKTSLDELPSIWNVIKGDMNLVGPRPLLPEYEKLYTAEQNKRHLVKPGITGWGSSQWTECNQLGGKV